MNIIRLTFAFLLSVGAAQAAFLNYVETAVNDADGATIAAMSSNQWLTATQSYFTTSAPVSWSTYRFTHWSFSDDPTALHRDAWGRALNPVPFTLLVARTATAHYLLATRDTDSDGVPDWFEIEYYGSLANSAVSDTDGDSVTLLAEYSAGTHPLFANSATEGGIAIADSGLITCNLAGYPTYTLRSEPAGTVNQSATVVPGTVITTANLSTQTGFGFWTLDSVRQQDAWGVALTQLTFTVSTANREAVAYLFTGDTDSDGVPDAFEQRYYGTLANNASSDTDGDGVTLLAEYSAGTHPLFANSATEGGVAWADTALITCNLAGYPSYTMRSLPAGTVNQSAVVTSGTVVTTPELSSNSTFGFWTLDGVRQQDAWGFAFTQLTFAVNAADRDAVAYLFVGDSDSDGVPDAYEQRYYGTLAHNGSSDSDGDGRTLLTEYTAGTHPLYANSSSEGDVASADSVLITADLQPEIAVLRTSTDLASGSTQDCGAIYATSGTNTTFTIMNRGGTDLTGISLAIDGANAAEFSIATAPGSSLAHLATTTFNVEFRPVSVGVKMATLRIASNDPDESTFTLVLTGTGLNNPPTISNFADLTLPRNRAGPVLALTIGDAETAVSELTISVSSTVPRVVPTSAIVITGTGATRSVTITPATDEVGSSLITISVSDGSATASTSFTVSVAAYPPEAATGSATSTTPNSALLNGTVNPHGFTTVARFDYGPTIDLGQSIAVALTPADGTSPQSLIGALSDLSPLTTYYFRVVATSDQGVSVGGVSTFSTTGVAPTVTTQPKSQTLAAGSTLTLTAAATGLPAPTCQWRKDGAPIPNATSATLVITSVVAGDAGNYTVEFTNGVGTTLSEIANVVVGRKSQSITFAAVGDKSLLDPPFALSASASSGLPVTLASSDLAVLMIDRGVAIIAGPGEVTLTASQAGNDEFLPATATQTITIRGTTTTTLVADDFIGAPNSLPDAARYQWSGDIAINGANQLSLSTNIANTTWIRSRAGAAPAGGETLVLQFRAAAYVEDWYPGIYGDGQPRGLRVGTDAGNVAEFYSAANNTVGLRVRRDGVETKQTVNVGVNLNTAMHDYEIDVTPSAVVFKFNGVVIGTITTNIPTGALNFYCSTFDSYAGNVPVTIEHLLLERRGASVTGFGAWQQLQFDSAALANPAISGPNAVLTADGLPNLVKYALGLDRWGSGPAMRPIVEVSDMYWSLTFTRPTNRSDITYALEISTDLVRWTSDGVTGEKLSEEAGIQTWRVRYSKAAAPTIFLRLKVERTAN